MFFLMINDFSRVGGQLIWVPVFNGGVLQNEKF
ncbi:hypothetical protein GGU45_000344 [Niabella hirudinis]